MSETYYLDTVNLLDAAHSYAKAAARRICADGDIDEASMAALAMLDAISKARHELELRHAALSAISTSTERRTNP